MDVEELCQSIQAKVKSFEQRELSQMRQGAVLQRKLDDKVKEVEALRKQRGAEQEQAVRRLEEQRQVKTSANEDKFLEETQALQTDLQQRMEASRDRLAALDCSAVESQARRRKLEADISYWRESGQLLNAYDENPGRGAQAAAGDPGSGEEVAVLSAECDQVVAEMEALRCSCESLSDQLSEVQRFATSARSEEMRLRGRSAELEATIARAESGARQAQERAAASCQKEQALLADTQAIRARMEQEQRRIAGQSSPGASPEEVSYLRRKAEEQQRQMEKLQLERTRLQEALRRHADLPHREAAGAAKDVAVGEQADPFSEMVSWFAMLLFKSVLVRRFFCVHLAVLYSWLLFLLWWMSSGESLMPEPSTPLTGG